MSATDIKNTFSSTGELDVSIPPTSLILKLAITKRSIRYFIQSAYHEQIIFFGEHTLHHVETDADLIQRVERIFEKDDVLQLAFGTKLIALNPPYSLIPSGFYFPDSNTLGTAINQKIVDIGTDLIFNLDTTLYYKLKALFSSSSIVHLQSSLLNSLPAYINDADKLFVNVELGQFDIVRFTATGGLQLMNRYDYQTDTDFAYFLMLCCDELKIDRESCRLILSGEVDTDSKIYDMCRKYFRTVSFILPNDDISFSKAFESFPKHLHFNLYTLTQ